MLGWQFRIATNDIQISQLGFLGIAVALLGRNTAIGTLFAALLFGALLNGTSVRNLDPTVFEPELATNLTLHHPGPDRAVRLSADVHRDLRCWRCGAKLRRGRRRPARGGGRVSTAAPRPAAPTAARASCAPLARLGGRRARRRSRCFIALPPLLVRTPVPSSCSRLLGDRRSARGRSRGGEQRLGWGAVVAGVVGGVGGDRARRKSGVGNLERVVVWSALFAAMLRYATPLIFARARRRRLRALAASSTSALEGMMLMGAFFGVWGADLTGSWFGGLLDRRWPRAACSALMHAVFAVTLRADQIVSGTAINFLALGITGYLFVDHLRRRRARRTTCPQVPDVTCRSSWIPFFGDVARQLNLLVWLALHARRRCCRSFLFRTPRGPAPALGRREPAGGRDGGHLGRRARATWP